MKFIPAISLLLSLSLAAFANATPTPSISCPSGPSYNVFGVSGAAKSIFNAHADSGSSSSEASATSVLPNPLHIRGGELHEPESVEDVDSLVSNAAASNQLVVIDFTASWCGPCKVIAPLFKEMSEEMTNVVFLKVDVDENPETAAKYSVSAMPTFLFIKSGEVVDRLMGANGARLQELIEEHM